MWFLEIVCLYMQKAAEGGFCDQRIAAEDKQNHQKQEKLLWKATEGGFSFIINVYYISASSATNFNSLNV